MTTSRHAVVAAIAGATLFAAAAWPAKAIVTEAESGAHVPPPAQQRYYHRAHSAPIVIGALTSMPHGWQKTTGDWVDPTNAPDPVLIKGRSISVLPPSDRSGNH